MKNTNKIELLAPAGNFQSFKSALNNGADAIYLGLSDFNARGNIENFTLENLKDVTREAHLFGVKIYLTLNTLLQDDEFENVTKLVKGAIECGVDAFIVQDLGLAYFLSKKFSGIELHASTQMGIQNLEGVKFLEKIGYKRVVLARETPLNEIKRIKENSNIEIEYFIQGALCVGYSGNCYLCSLLAGASGNRGKCKQFCRLPTKMYSNKNELLKSGYLLSTKDFCMLPQLKELVENGVSSLKIEGRARRSAYVGGVTKIYRNALDNNFKFQKDDIVSLKKLFNRGDYIEGYFGDDKIIYSKVQNHIGIKIGKVVSFKKGKRFNEIIIQTKHKLRQGDSVKFLLDEREVTSLNIQDIKEIEKDLFLVTTTAVVPIKADVNLIVDKNFEDKIQNEKRKIYVTAFLQAKVGQRAKLMMYVGEINVSVEGNEILQASINQPLTKDEVINQLSKLGENYSLTNVECDLDDIFMRKAELNELRRNCIKKLEEKIIENYKKNREKIVENKIINKNDIKNQKNDIKNQKNQLKNILVFNSLKSLGNNISSEDYLVYSPSIYNREEIVNFCQKNSDKTIYLDMPLIVTFADINYLKSIFEKCVNLGVYATNYYCLSFASPEKTIISSEMNVFNSHAIEFYSKNGYKKIVLSKENFDFNDINSCDCQTFLPQSVKNRLIYFKHCPFKEHIGGDCLNCKFKDGISYSIGGKLLNLKRKKTVNCYFYLCENNAKQNTNKKFGNVIEID